MCTHSDIIFVMNWEYSNERKLCIQSDDLSAERYWFEAGIMELPAISDTGERDTVQKNISDIILKLLSCQI